MVKRILVPLDGSEHADKALDFAIDIAARRGAELLLLHVLLRDAEPDELQRLAGRSALAASEREQIERANALQSAQMAVAAGYVPPTLPKDVLERIGQQILDAAKSRVLAGGVTEVRSLLEQGNPARRILAAAEREAVDAIVMGSRGLGYLEGMLTGSVSHKVAHRFAGTCVLVK